MALFFLIVAVCALLHIRFINQQVDIEQLPGGVLGALCATGLIAVVNKFGASIILIAAFLAGTTLFTGLSWLGLLDWLGRKSLWTLSWLKQTAQRVGENMGQWRTNMATAQEAAVPEFIAQAPQKQAPVIKMPPRITPEPPPTPAAAVVEEKKSTANCPADPSD